MPFCFLHSKYITIYFIFCICRFQVGNQVDLIAIEDSSPAVLKSDENVSVTPSKALCENGRASVDMGLDRTECGGNIEMLDKSENTVTDNNQEIVGIQLSESAMYLMHRVIWKGKGVNQLLLNQDASADECWNVSSLLDSFMM